MLSFGDVVSGIISLLILGAVLFGVVFCISGCTRNTKSAIKKLPRFFREQLFDRLSAQGNKYVEDFVRNHESMAPKRYTYKDIKKMTKFFRDKLGEGGSSVVYKGKLLDGRLVAVKMLKLSKGDARDFVNEIARISRANHVNLVTLLGFCFQGRKRGLVYEFMPNGSLEKFTRAGANTSQLLSSETLFQIALGIARGLEYLHISSCNTRILHFDIKPHNILLDESFCPKISNFALAKLDPHSTSFTPDARATIGCIAPEVFYRHFGNVSHKSDVYSYGMIVLDMIGCREYANADTDTSSNDYFPDWIYKQLNRQEEQDGDWMIDSEEKGLQRKLISVSLWCIQPIPSSRPSMARVVQILQGSVESIQVGPIVSSPPRPQADPSASSTMLTNDSSFEIQQLQEIPSGATRSSLGVSHSFPTGNPSCSRDPIPTARFSL